MLVGCASAPSTEDERYGDILHGDIFDGAVPIAPDYLMHHCTYRTTSPHLACVSEAVVTIEAMRRRGELTPDRTDPHLLQGYVWIMEGYPQFREEVKQQVQRQYCPHAQKFLRETPLPKPKTEPLRRLLHNRCARRI